MFDGTGMNDSVFQAGNQAGQYQTYKLALYIYASKVLGYPVNETTEADMLKMQGASGGFPTGYDSNFSNDGTNTNVETTSLAILALLPTPPTRTPNPPPSPQSPTPTITPTPTLTQPIIIGAFVASAVAVSASLLVYFKKHKLTN